MLKFLKKIPELFARSPIPANPDSFLTAAIETQDLRPQAIIEKYALQAAREYGGRIDYAIRTGLRLGWRPVEHKPDQFMIRFKKGKDTLLDYWYSKNTVGTVVSHPSGRRQPLFRRNVDKAMLQTLFKNPRAHTGEGYYER